MVNIWKVMTIALFFIVVCLGFVLASPMFIDYEIRGVEISKASVDDISEGVGENFVVCNLETRQCVYFNKIE